MARGLGKVARVPGGFLVCFSFVVRKGRDKARES